MMQINDFKRSTSLHGYSPLSGLFDSTSIDPKDNNRLAVAVHFKGRIRIDDKVKNGAPSEAVQLLGLDSTPEALWRKIPTQLGFCKEEEITLELNPKPDRSFNTGCIILDAFLTYYQHTPLLRSLFESLYWTYSIEFTKVNERRWSTARS